MIRFKKRKGLLAGSAPPALASIVMVSLVVFSGLAYAWPSSGDKPPRQPNIDLDVTSMNKVNGPPYALFSVLSPLPDALAIFKVGPFAPSDTVVISYTVKNTGTVPVSLFSFGPLVIQSGSGFTATSGPIPGSLNPGGSYSSIITVTLRAGLGNRFERMSALIWLTTIGEGEHSTSTCSGTSTSTVTRTFSTSCQWDDDCD